MKVLLITAAFYPGNSPRSFRATELARELARQGHHVVVATPDQGNIHREKSIEWKLVIEDKAPEISAALRSRYFTNPMFARIGNRLAEWVFEYPDIQYYGWAKKIATLYSGFDLMITIAAPHAIHWGVAASIHATKHKAAGTWIADCGDPFMGSKMNALPKMPWFAFFEHRFCQMTDFITVPVQEAVPAYYPAYRYKIKIIPQGFNFEESTGFRKEYVKNQIPTFGFAGSLSPNKRDPRKMLEYLIKARRPFLFVLYTNAAHLVNSLADKSDGRIIVKPYIPREELIGELSTMDFLVNFENEVSEQVPSKLIDYYLMGRPVVSIHADTDFDVVLRSFLDGDYSNAMTYSNPDEYNIVNVANKFLALSNNNDNGTK